MSYSKLNRTLNARRYRKTKYGLLSTIYTNMLYRVTGKCTKKSSSYIGLEIIKRSEFYSWAMNNVVFNKIFLDWKMSGHEAHLTPSVDRIDSSLGYALNNMRFITVSINSKISDKKKLKKANSTSSYIGVSKKRNKWRAYFFLNNKQINIGTFNTEIEAAKARDNVVKSKYDFPTLNFYE